MTPPRQYTKIYYRSRKSGQVCNLIIQVLGPETAHTRFYKILPREDYEVVRTELHHSLPTPPSSQ